MVFDCRECGEKEEKKNQCGCKCEAERMVWETDYCFFCHGIDPNCIYCKGSNHNPVYRCPRALAFEVSWLLPYFIDWRVSNRVVWPDGGSRLYQTVKLAESFDLLDEFISERVNEPKSSNNT
jgi:hypothetical protein